MKIEKHKLIIKTTITILVVFIFAFISFAWYKNTYTYPNDILGRTKVNYFADGNGTVNDPYIIAEPDHFYNLSRLQNLGYFNDQQYYFKVSDINGNPTTIDFSTLAEDDFRRYIEPIGDNTYPFIGEVNGNFSLIKGIRVIDGGKQDIGVFGYLFSDVTIQSYVHDLFLEEPLIISVPQSTDDKTGFHIHNNQLVNRATGYIAGHLDDSAILENVFVISPTINSNSNTLETPTLFNNDANRSQFGLVGYDATTSGEIQGSPSEAYAFTLDAPSAYAAMNYARSTYSSYFVNGGSTVVLGDVLDANLTIASGYSLSTLRISQTANDPDPVYLYDQLVLDGYPIGANGSEYNRENIDVVGIIDFNPSQYQIFQNLSDFTTPSLGITFDPTNYPDAVFMYVRPTNNLQDLGNVTGTYSGGGDLSYLSGFDTSGNYIPNRAYANKNAPGVVNFGASGVTQTMTAQNAWAAVRQEANGSLTVVDPNVDVVDFYVFLVAVTNGQITFNNIVFEYLPQELVSDDFLKVSQIDYINLGQIVSVGDTVYDGFVSSVLADTYTFTQVYFTYDIIANQRLEINTARSENVPGSGTYDRYDIYIDYSILDSSFFYIDIYNVLSPNYNIYIHINGVTLNSGNPYTNLIIGIKFFSGSYEITPI